MIADPPPLKFHLLCTEPPLAAVYLEGLRFLPISRNDSGNWPKFMPPASWPCVRRPPQPLLGISEGFWCVLVVLGGYYSLFVVVGGFWCLYVICGGSWLFLVVLMV